MTVHVFLIELDYPQALKDLFGGFFPLIVFDVVPTDYVYEQIFHLDSLEPD
jgi:hypothetical protein